MRAWARSAWRRWLLLASCGVKAAPMIFALTFVLMMGRGVATALYAYGIKVFVDGIVHHQSGQMIDGVVLVGVLNAVNWICLVPGAWTAGLLTERTDLYLATRTAELVNAIPGIEQFERDDYARELDLLTARRPQLASSPYQALQIAYIVVRTVIMVVLLATVNHWFLLLPLFAAAPLVADIWTARYRQRTESALAEPMRLSGQLFAIAASGASAKELRVFGLADELRRRHAQAMAEVEAGTDRSGLVTLAVGSLGWMLFAGGFVACLVLAVIGAVDGQVTPGQLVMTVVLVQLVQQQLGQVTGATGTIQEAKRVAGRLVWLLEFAERARERGERAAVPESLSEGIVLSDLSFAYPAGPAPALAGVSLRLRPGTCVALVGENGAGKTTLVKLLTGMYPPSAGSISIDGRDLAQLDRRAWQDEVAATFQEFMRYEFLAREAVGVGDLPRLDDEDALLAALDRAGAEDLVAELSEGIDTQLGRTFSAGQELSGGQWQKVALARGRMRQYPLLLVLDEPTASLDAVAERSLFEHYRRAMREAAAARGSITVLVSHRFSTVRMADLIVVLDGGQVREVGSHEELVARGDLYAELYRLQERVYQ